MKCEVRNAECGDKQSRIAICGLHQGGRVPALSAILIVAAICLLLPQGCKTVKPAPPQAAATGPVFFPLPPDTPRVQYLGSITSPKDLPARRGKFADFVLGPEPETGGLLKPNCAILVGNRLYASDTVMNTVVVFDLATGESRALLGDGGSGKIRQPNSLKRDDQGNFYVADKTRQAVLVYGPDEKFLHAWGRPNETEPVDIAIGKSVLYVLNFKTQAIETWDRQSGKLIKTLGSRGVGPGQFYMPTHLALDSAENLYVTDTGNFRVQVFGPEFKLLRTLGGQGDTLGKFAWPKGLDVDAKGRLFVADSRFYNVQIFDPAGHLLMFFGGPGRDGGYVELPAGVTVQPWPEAVDWLKSKVAPGFDPESLAIVVSQQGDRKINFFAVARDKTAAP